MKIIRARSPKAIELISDRFVNADASLAQWLREMIRDEKLFVLCCIEGDKILSFCVAFAPQNLPYAILYQAWGKEHLDEMFLRLQVWCENMGKTAIRAETTRNPDALYRRWGFKHISSVVEYRLREDTLSRLVEGRRDLVVRRDDDGIGDADNSAKVGDGVVPDAVSAEGGVLAGAGDNGAAGTVESKSDSAMERPAVEGTDGSDCSGNPELNVVSGSTE